MRKISIVLVVSAFIFITAVNSFAAHVNIPTSVKEMKGGFFSDENASTGVSLSADVDIVDERELNRPEGKIKALFYTLKLIFSFDEKVDLYGFFGEAQDMKYESKILNAEVKYELEDEKVWGVGLSSLIYDWYRFGLTFFGDAEYRRIRHVEYNSLTVNGVEFPKSQLTAPQEDAEWDEWRIALGVAKQIDLFVFYGGVKFSDVDVKALATAGGVTYDLGASSSDHIIGPFLGFSFVPMEQFSIDVQGCLIDERAVSVSLVYKF